MARKVQKKKAAKAKAAQPKKSAKKSAKKKTVAARSPEKKKAKKISKPVAKKKALKKTPAAAKPAKKKPPAKAAKVSSAPKKKSVKTAPKPRAKAAAAARAPKPSPLPRKIVARRKNLLVQRAAAAARKKQEAAHAARLAAERHALEKQAQNYEKGVGYFNRRKFSRALQWFAKAAEGPEPTLRHRAHIHARICEQRVNSKKVKLKTADDYYNYAVKLINDRELEEAESCLDKALRLSADADHVHYAASIVRALRGDTAAAIRSLERAIELNGRNRLMARTDVDLSSLRDHPSWTNLISSDAPSRSTL